MTPVFIDLTEFFAARERTGIQRVCAEMCRCWPDQNLVPVKLTRDRGLVRLSQSALGSIHGYFQGHLDELSEQAEASGEPLELSGGVKVLVPELFYDPQRVDFFRRLSPEQWKSFHFILYDLLPFTHPEFFAPDLPHEIIHGYCWVVRQAQHVAFISGATRRAYYQRLLREFTTPGPVLRLGSDSLGSRATAPPQRDPRHKFSVVGTIEPRKNHALILEVFEKLNKDRRVHLTFLGKMGWVDSWLSDKIRAMAKEAWFEYQPQPSDEDIRNCVQESRATIYASAVEGFGLPPVESLWLGTPVITAPNIPSLEVIASHGVHIVDPMDAEGLSKAVLAFLDDTYLESKTREALQLPLPTWRSFAAEAAAWISRL